MRIELPDIPADIDFEDLGDPETGRLYNEEESKKIIAALEGHAKPYRYSKDEVGFFLQPENPKKAPFGIFHDADGEVYAIYKGSKHHKELGEGAFGKVKYAQNIRTGEWVVLKVQEVGEESHKIKIAAQEQENIRFITGRKDSTIVKRPSKQTGREKIAFVMPYAGEINLEQFCFERQDTLTAAAALNIAHQLAVSLQDMHQQGMIHRDIKLANIVCHLSKGAFSWIDFGFARQISKETQSCEDIPCTGTPDYMAPEIIPQTMHKNFKESFTIDQLGKAITIKNSKAVCEYTTKTDIYAFGILLQELFGMRETVFQDKDEKGRNVWCEFSLPNSFKEDLLLRKLLTDMTSAKPADRPSIEAIIETLTRAQHNPRYRSRPNASLINIDNIDKILTNKNALEQYHSQDIIYLTATEKPPSTTEWIKKIQKLKAQGLPISPTVLIGPREYCKEDARQLNQERMENISPGHRHSKKI